MENNKLLIEQIICSNYIKYDKLTSIINTVFAGSNKENINIYIDLYSIFSKLYSNNYFIQDYSTITSCVINMCAHYREFFKTRYQCTTSFYIIYSDNIPYVNNQLVPSYNRKYKDTITNNSKIYEMIRSNCALLETICPYLPDIYYLETSFEAGTMIFDIMSKYDQKDEKVHIIISKDVYLYQLVLYKPDTVILRPKKYKSEDLSYYIDKNNIMIEYYKYRKWKEKPNLYLFPENLLYIMALTSFPERNIKAKYSISQLMKYLTLSDGYSLIKGNKELEHRYNGIDLKFQHIIFMSNPDSKYTLKSLYDIGGIQEINNKYFVKNPLDLNRL